MDSSKEYYRYVQGYGNYEGLGEEGDKGGLYKHPVYRSIPYYNNEIKSLQDISKSYPASEQLEDMYYEQGAKSSSARDVDLIYNDGYPSYRMVNTPSPRVLDLSQKEHAGAAASPRSEGSVPSELAKLTEVIKELTARLPVPPSPELLKSVHPNLAVKLQLTYLKAYIQNQQLLMDLKSKIEGSYGPEAPKFSGVGADARELNGGSELNYPIVEIRPQYPQIANLQASSSIGSEDQFAGEAGAQGGGQLGTLNCPQLANYQNLYYQLTSQPNYALPQLTDYPQLTNYPQATNYPQLTDYPQLTNYPQGTSYPQLTDYPQLTNYPQGTSYPQLTDGSGYQYVNGRYEDGGYENAGYGGGLGEKGEYARRGENPALLVPAEYRDRVKYNAKKKAFYSVYLSSLGSRRRKSFSINKFGLAKALRLSIDFANQLPLEAGRPEGGDAQGPDSPRLEATCESPALAVRERNLVQDVCEHALSVNRRTCEDFALFERALTMPRVRGLVYCPGSNLWMCIFYKGGKRRIQCFPVDEFGFERAYQRGLALFAGDPQLVRSKLSGVLSYWLEPVPTMTLVIIFKTRQPSLGSGAQLEPRPAQAGGGGDGSCGAAEELDGAGKGADKGYDQAGAGSSPEDADGGANARRNAAGHPRGDPRGDPERIYMARFELEVHGSFVAAKKASQSWFKCIRKYLAHLGGAQVGSGSLNGAGTGRDSSPESGACGAKGEAAVAQGGPPRAAASQPGLSSFLDPDLLRLGFVYYDDDAREWVVVDAAQSVRFSADALGRLEAKKQAISLRQKQLVSSALQPRD